jgi:hypothetical protein
MIASEASAQVTVMGTVMPRQVAKDPSVIASTPTTIRKHPVTSSLLNEADVGFISASRFTSLQNGHESHNTSESFKVSNLWPQRGQITRESVSGGFAVIAVRGRLAIGSAPWSMVMHSVSLAPQ